MTRVPDRSLRGIQGKGISPKRSTWRNDCFSGFTVNNCGTVVTLVMECYLFYNSALGLKWVLSLLQQSKREAL